MGAEAQDAIWSMGDDAPMAVLSRMPRPLYAYFRQRFAQVTNPPIDPLREGLVMSLDTYLGRRGNCWQRARSTPRLCTSPLRCSWTTRWAALMPRPSSGPWCCPSPSTPAGGEAALERGPGGARQGAVQAVDAGEALLILSDREVDEGQAADPAAAGHRRRAPPPDPRRHADAGRPDRRDRRRLGHPPPGLPHRLRRLGGPPLPGPGRQPGLRRAARLREHARDGAGGALPQGRGQGPVPDHVQDGHLRRLVATAGRRSSRPSGSARP